MSYFLDLGELYPSDFCTDLNPQKNCSPLKGIAKPMTASALIQFQTLQRQINRLLAIGGKSPIGVDGRIGPGTVKAANAVSKAYGAPGTQWTHTDALAIQADSAGAAFKAEADRRGVKIVKDPKSASPPTVLGPNNVVQNPSNLAIQTSGLVSLASSPLGLAALAIGGILLYKATSGPVKKKGARKPPAVRRRRVPRQRITTTMY